MCLGREEGVSSQWLLHVIFRGLEVMLTICYERRYGGQLEIVKTIKMLTCSKHLPHVLGTWKDFSNNALNVKWLVG